MKKTKDDFRREYDFYFECSNRFHQTWMLLKCCLLHLTKVNESLSKTEEDEKNEILLARLEYFDIQLQTLHCSCRVDYALTSMRCRK